MDRHDNPIKRLLDRLGPGLITGASDDDPSGIGTYTQAGAALGYATLWTAIVTLPLMIVVQHICAKIGMCGGRGLAAVLRKFYPRWMLYPAVAGLVIANTINAGADIAAISAAINMFVPIPIWAMVIPIAGAIVVLQIWGSYR
ncbi:MAG: divalent metal cation transporter, partial [Gammaproteobacteria bacterium]